MFHHPDEALTVAVPTDRQVGDDGSGALQMSREGVFPRPYRHPVPSRQIDVTNLNLIKKNFKKDWLSYQEELPLYKWERLPKLSLKKEN